jgi:threonyl-tRNA synthetase
VPYMLIVGDKEAETRAVALRRHGDGDQGTRPLEEVIGHLTGRNAGEAGRGDERSEAGAR